MVQDRDGDSYSVAFPFLDLQFVAQLRQERQHGSDTSHYDYVPNVKPQPIRDAKHNPKHQRKALADRRRATYGN